MDRDSISLSTAAMVQIAHTIWKREDLKSFIVTLVDLGWSYRWLEQFKPIKPLHAQIDKMVLPRCMIQPLKETVDEVAIRIIDWIKMIQCKSEIPLIARHCFDHIHLNPQGFVDNEKTLRSMCKAKILPFHPTTSRLLLAMHVLPFYREYVAELLANSDFMYGDWPRIETEEPKSEIDSTR